MTSEEQWIHTQLTGVDCPMRLDLPCSVIVVRKLCEFNEFSRFYTFFKFFVRNKIILYF